MGSRAEPERGSTMMMISKETAGTPAGKQGGSEGRRGATVLVVDDDEDVRDVLFEMLDGAGYDVVLAENGREAMEALMGGVRPAAIVLDVMMPVANGFAFRVWQRAQPELARIPILVATAAPLSSEAMAELAPDIRLQKPFELRELMGALETLVGRTGDRVGAAR
jgi:CheY-like chemotaxis protein